MTEIEAYFNKFYPGTLTKKVTFGLGPSSFFGRFISNGISSNILRLLLLVLPVFLPVPVYHVHLL